MMLCSFLVGDPYTLENMICTSHTGNINFIPDVYLILQIPCQPLSLLPLPVQEVNGHLFHRVFGYPVEAHVVKQEAKSRDIG